MGLEKHGKVKSSGRSKQAALVASGRADCRGQQPIGCVTFVLFDRVASSQPVPYLGAGLGFVNFSRDRSGESELPHRHRRQSRGSGCPALTSGERISGHMAHVSIGMVLLPVGLPLTRFNPSGRVKVDDAGGVSHSRARLALEHNVAV